MQFPKESSELKNTEAKNLWEALVREGDSRLPFAPHHPIIVPISSPDKAMSLERMII